jgi:hypothetical protein
VVAGSDIQIGGGGGGSFGPLTGDVTTVGDAATLVATANVESIITANATVAAAAPKASPTFTGTVTIPDGVGAHTAAAVGQIPVAADGYGITGNTGLTPTPVVGLSVVAGSLSADVSLAQNTLTTIITTGALAAGTWLVTVGFPVETGAANESVDVETVVGTATATFSGQSASSVGYTQAVGAGVLLYVALNFLCVVTVAGTLVIQCEMAGGATAATVKNTSQTQGYANAAGYTAVRIA